MSDPAIQDTAPAKEQKRGGGSLLVDLGPVLLFMVAYNIAHRTQPENAIFIATGVFMAATLVALGYAFFVQKRVAPMLIVTAVVVAIFGGLTIYLHDATFVKMKPTVIYLLFAGAIFGGLLFKQNVLSMLMQGSLDLPQKVRDTLAIRYGLFFVFLAGLNEVIWRNFSEEFWVNFKLFGTFGLIALFSVANFPLISKHMKDEEAPAPSAE